MVWRSPANSTRASARARCTWFCWPRPEELKGDAAANYRMLQACGCPVLREIPPEARNATLVVDALLGTGIAGPAAGRMLEGIREINRGFPLAKVVAVDIPSGHAERFGRAGGRMRARRLHRHLHRAQSGARPAAELRPHRAS